jgi:hypothetical protein
MRMIEDRFNKNYHYPWTFMNNRPFTADVCPHELRCVLLCGC